MFKDEFKKTNEDFSIKVIKTTRSKKINEKTSTIEDVRDAGIKVKSTIPLPGNNTVYEFFSKNDAIEANKILKGKLKDKTIIV